ncbi:MAG TPA: bifunctional riboflavin kinase/FAD synthetase [Syntrophales bacterium]|nr:bifunctional riboflavin kinase/FAD synthetase [Syntrophales bacterium]
MKIVNTLQNVPPDLKGAVITIGNFDGVHIGHRRIFEKVIADARHLGGPAVVMTFEPHPKQVLHPERRPFYLITTVAEKLRLIEVAGVDAVWLVPFSLDFAARTATSFVEDILIEGLAIRKVTIGHDYTFGRGREGNEAFLKAMGRKRGFEVDVVNAFRIGETIISSTAIREAILAGEVSQAAAMLGRPYNLAGRVVVGHRRGAGLGFPTANLEPEKVLVPARGVYAVRARVSGGSYAGVLNIGENPTFGDGRRSIEVHLLGFAGDVYGEPLEVQFIERLRGEVKFDGPDALVAQIRKDIDRARRILSV